MDMRAVLVALCLLLVSPITGHWWASGSQVVMDPMVVCKKTRKGRLAEVCKKEPAVLREITRGLAMGTKECQYQFRNRRWNCTNARRSMRKVLLRDTRETGFVNAIATAGVTFAVARACSTNENENLNCHCGRGATTGGRASKGPQPPPPPPPPLPPPPRGAVPGGDPGLTSDWKWDGCGDNINYGLRVSKIFMDAPHRRRRKRSDIKTLVKLHNNDAGRLAIKNFMRVHCKCHGLSGSCTLRTCWRHMPAFREVGDRLKERFDGAAKVIPNNDGSSFLPDGGSTIKPPGRGDLVYSEDSPDFCAPNRKTGSLGTQGRVCNATSPDVEGCALLCCHRGYDTRKVSVKVNCECRFKWCCEVTCRTCTERRSISTCR
ncbi:hypothetical protein R5R35_000478 [Gryllus longicercus]|uniref:Protein Wnt n=1 Tax=Gryllus longicercus TaxID=2509291 RepID=A0AAN9YYB8_9ORTH